jgi:hypothetical protein
MRGLRFAHHNNCPRCPTIGAEDIPGDEFFEFRSLRFNLQVARKLATPSMLHRVDPAGLTTWLEHVNIDQRHIDHLPAAPGPGLMVTFPAGLGRPLIDGNHRAARALRDGREFVVHLLPEAETLLLLRSSMGKPVADRWWQTMAASQPDPNDTPEGDMR